MKARRATARRTAGGKQHVGRPSLPVVAYRRLVMGLASTRAHWRCEYCLGTGPLEPHHVVKRSAGGPDHARNLVLLCHGCHQQTDAPYAQGRLVIVLEEAREELLFQRSGEIVGAFSRPAGYRFRCAIRTGPSKYQWSEDGVKIITV